MECTVKIALKNKSKRIQDLRSEKHFPNLNGSVSKIIHVFVGLFEVRIGRSQKEDSSLSVKPGFFVAYLLKKFVTCHNQMHHQTVLKLNSMSGRDNAPEH